MISPFRAAVVKIMKSLGHKLFFPLLWVELYKTGKRLISSFEIHHPPLNWPNNARQEPEADGGRIRWEIIKSFPRNKKPPFCSEPRSFYFPFLFALWSFLTGLWGHVDKRIVTFSSSLAGGQSLIFYAWKAAERLKALFIVDESEKLSALAFTCLCHQRWARGKCIILQTPKSGGASFPVEMYNISLLL